MGKLRLASIGAALFTLQTFIHAWVGAGTDWILASGFAGVTFALLAALDE